MPKLGNVLGAINLAYADAVVSDVKIPKTFFSIKMPRKTGTLDQSDADISASDIKLNKIGYNNFNKITGTLDESDADIIAAYIMLNRVGYNNFVKVIGTLDESDADAVASDLKLNKIVYVNFIKVTGSLDESDADIIASDIKLNKIGYNNLVKVIGTLDESDADIIATDVLLNKIGYNNLVKVIGTLQLTGDAAVSDVRLAKLFYKDDPASQLTGTADLVEIANAEGTIKETGTSDDAHIYRTTAGYANGATIISCTITVPAGKRCFIVIVSCMLIPSLADEKMTDIERGGAVKTIETTISGGDTNNYRLHLQYACEVLNAGAYQYDLVNTAGSTKYFFGAVIKAVAVDFE